MRQCAVITPVVKRIEERPDLSCHIARGYHLLLVLLVKASLGRYLDEESRMSTSFVEFTRVIETTPSLRVHCAHLVSIWNRQQHLKFTFKRLNISKANVNKSKAPRRATLKFFFLVFRIHFCFLSKTNNFKHTILNNKFFFCTSYQVIHNFFFFKN